MRLPPLNALRAFESAARTGSFTAAGQALGVSSAAVSQQVRKLEAYLGRQLFLRQNNQLLLTDAGRDLYVNAASALDQISRFTESIARPTGPKPLVISALPSLAERWLPEVLAQYDAAPVRLRIEEDPVEMEAEGVDIRLCYGGDGYDGFWRRTLFHDRLAPMARDAADWDTAVPDWTGLRPIHMDWGPSFLRTPKWADWCAARDVPPPEGPGITVPGGAAALTLAEAGAGVALGQIALARGALNAGRLRQLSDCTIPLPEPYMLTIAHARLKAPRIRAFLACLPG